MKLLKRNTTPFTYLACTGKNEVLDNGRHTGQHKATYADPVEYAGMMGLPNGYTQNQFFGITKTYTHVLLLDDPKADIREEGLVHWNGDDYEIIAVRPSLNVLSVALRKLTASGMEPFEREGDHW